MPKYPSFPVVDLDTTNTADNCDQHWIVNIPNGVTISRRFPCRVRASKSSFLGFKRRIRWGGRPRQASRWGNARSDRREAVMPSVLIRHKVQDYSNWKPLFDAFVSCRTGCNDFRKSNRRAVSTPWRIWMRTATTSQASSVKCLPTCFAFIRPRSLGIARIYTGWPFRSAKAYK